MDDYKYYMEILGSGNKDELEELSLLDDNFPNGEDNFISRRWIINAIDCGNIESVKWMLDKGVDLNFRDEEGTTVLHSAIDRDLENKHEILELLIEAGADINKKGFNDWTPAHTAAARNDVESLEILVKHGANLSIQTDIDEYATPLEEARILDKFHDCKDAINYLESILNQKN